MSFWDFLIWFFWVYLWVVCIWIFITVIIDIFRDPELNGWAKALWVLFLVAVPFLAAFIYLIARGRSMSKRGLEQARAQQAEQAEYIRTVSGGGTSGPSLAEEIEKAKGLLDSGAITQAEYDAIKAKALATV